MKNKNLIAWALLILLAIIWGSSPILIKKALIKLDPFEIGALRLTLASFVLFPFLTKNLKEIRRKDYLILFISGYYDGATQYFDAKYTMWHIDPSGKMKDRLSFKGYESGHMMYLRREDLKNSNDDIREFIRNTIPSKPAKY